MMMNTMFREDYPHNISTIEGLDEAFKRKEMAMWRVRHATLNNNTIKDPL